MQVDFSGDRASQRMKMSAKAFLTFHVIILSVLTVSAELIRRSNNRASSSTKRGRTELNGPISGEAGPFFFTSPDWS